MSIFERLWKCIHSRTGNRDKSTTRITVFYVSGSYEYAAPEVMLDIPGISSRFPD